MTDHIHSSNHPRPGCEDCESVLDRAIANAEAELLNARRDLYAARRMVEVAHAEEARELARIELIDARIGRLSSIHDRSFTNTPEEVSA